MVVTFENDDSNDDDDHDDNDNDDGEKPKLCDQHGGSLSYEVIQSSAGVPWGPITPSDRLRIDR